MAAPHAQSVASDEEDIIFDDTVYGVPDDVGDDDADDHAAKAASRKHVGGRLLRKKGLQARDFTLLGFREKAKREGTSVRRKKKQRYADGGVYEGEISGGVHHGKGKYTYPNGGVYEGEWKDGREHGYGKGTRGDGGCYEGEWDKGKPHGQGMYTYADGAIYQGSFEYGKRHGHGKYTFSDTGERRARERRGLREGEGAVCGRPWQSALVCGMASGWHVGRACGAAIVACSHVVVQTSRFAPLVAIGRRRRVRGSVRDGQAARAGQVHICRRPRV